VNVPQVLGDVLLINRPAGESKKLYDDLTSPKTFMMFTEEENAEEHCQIGASATSNARILGWLHELLK